MAYSKRTQKSRKYRKNEYYSRTSEQPSHDVINDTKANSLSDDTVAEDVEDEKRAPKTFGFLSSLFGSGEKTERSGTPLFSALGYDIYLDDLLLIGLIILLMTDKTEDEILLIILAYLLLDIF